jgi:hypothetical protein
MEPEGLLPCSRKPATGPYPDQLEPSTHTLPPYFPKINSNIILPSMPSSSGCHFPSDFPTKMFYHFLISQPVPNLSQ